MAGHGCRVEFREGREEEKKDHQGEWRSEGKREGNGKTGARLNNMERSGKTPVQCGFDFGCQSSVISENQSHI